MHETDSSNKRQMFLFLCLKGLSQKRRYSVIKKTKKRRYSGFIVLNSYANNAWQLLQVTRDVALLSHWMAIDLYIREVDSLRFELSMSRCSNKLESLAHEILLKGLVYSIVVDVLKWHSLLVLTSLLFLFLILKSGQVWYIYIYIFVLDSHIM